MPRKKKTTKKIKRSVGAIFLPTDEIMLGIKTIKKITKKPKRKKKPNKKTKKTKKSKK